MDKGFGAQWWILAEVLSSKNRITGALEVLKHATHTGREWRIWDGSCCSQANHLYTVYTTYFLYYLYIPKNLRMSTTLTACSTCSIRHGFQVQGRTNSLSCSLLEATRAQPDLASQHYMFIYRKRPADRTQLQKHDHHPTFRERLCKIINHESSVLES